MATLISAIETTSRLRLDEVTASFWTSAEIIEIIIAGVRDLWKAVVELKAEHFLTVDNTNVTLQASQGQLSGLPSNMHKVYMIEPRDMSNDSTSVGLVFKPLDWNHPSFQAARTRDAIDPKNDVIFYAVTGAGAPVNAPTILIAPQVNSSVNLSLAYVPTLGPLASTDYVPVPGEVDNALVAWTVAFARAKERDDKSPDPNWLKVYSTEKDLLLQSLALRQLQEPTFVDAIHQNYW